MNKINNILALICVGLAAVIGALIGYDYKDSVVPVKNVVKYDIPDVIFVRGHRWNTAEGLTVISVSKGKQETVDEYLDDLGKGEKFYGITDCPDNLILIHSNLSRANERDDLMHELLHAGTCDGATGRIDNFYYNSTNEEQHEGIYRISQYITELFHENPELVKYFISE